MDSCVQPQSSVLPSDNASFQDYVAMVQCLIERCLLLKLSRGECVATLAQRARIQPAITLAVWTGLEKANPRFFEAYARDLVSGEERRSKQADLAAYEQSCSNKIVDCLDLWRLPSNGS